MERRMSRGTIRRMDDAAALARNIVPDRQNHEKM
jgi:hypothetical protein